MKTIPLQPPNHSRAAALLIVLASLVFLAALGLAFLASIGTELKSSKQYAEGVNAKLLSQSAFNLATDQIVEATKGYTGADPADPGQPLAWASQPGMIRTYDTSGNKAGYFKLYSWDVMQGKGAFDPTANTEAIKTTWYQDPAIYTDLNKPIKVSGTFQYPIVDGNNLVSNVSDSSGSTVIPGKTYDADGNNKWDIEGFNVSTTAPVESGTANPVPMPVKWLYVLEGGQIVAPSGGSGNIATFSGSNSPTTSNPIVGRVAFWTDDESSKVNINTASEGVYWDTPRVKSKTDDILKIDQPVTGEYQRYPGHPAMTSLSTVIKRPASWNPGTPVPTFSGGSYPGAVAFTLCTPAAWLDYQWAQKLYGIAPRIGTGGSFAGSVQTAMLAAASIPAVSLDANRLYATTDELLFTPNRSFNNIELANQPVLDKSTLERAKFFLTASSRAPDVNLFNKPRVSIWPLSSATDSRTAYDRLIAFCTTMGSGAFYYYFQRQDPNSPTTDLSVGRNSSLLACLRSMANDNIPGFGGSFAAKYPLDKDQIFTEIFDYIRCTNLRDGLLVSPTEVNSKTYTKGISGSPWAGFNGIGQVVPIQDAATNTRGFGRYPTLQGASVLFIGQVDGDDPVVTVPPYPASTSQVDPISGKPLPIYSGTTLVAKTVDANSMRIQAAFLPQFFCPSVGSVWLRPNFQWSVDLSGLTLNGAPLNFPSNTNAGSPKHYTQNQTPKDETGFGDQLGLIQAVKAAGNNSNLVSSPIDVPKGSALSLAGAVTFKIWAADPVAAPGTSSTLLQTITLNFDNSPAFAVPDLAFNHVANKQSNGAFEFGTTTYYLNYRSFVDSTGRYNPADPNNPTSDVQGGRFKGGISTTNGGGFFMDGDAVRSVRVASGDTRLVAAQQNPPVALFEPNPTTDRLLGAHNFFTGYGHAYYGAALGKLVKDLAYSSGAYFTLNRHTTADGFQNVFYDQGYSQATDAPLNGMEAGSSTSITPTGVPGDWDNTVMANRDGPFINKPDEGDSGTTVFEPYFWKLKAQSPGSLSASLFSPNRQIPSAVNFGSLPTGVKANRPWQTLLFHPQPGHPGNKGYKGDGTADQTMPADHLLLDLFHMPVVEPYAISEPLSTAGRINMNFQIVPFTYINRDTGIRSLLKAEKVISIQDSQVGVYKHFKYTSSPNVTQASIRLDVNPEETLKGFLKRFDADKDLFRSASEICELYIVPVDGASTDDTYATMSTYWNTHRLTGDNSKERIYATLYPRLTTKSNTFTIHAKVQTLKKVVGTQPNVWTEGKDQVTGEYRGSQTIERFVDPNNTGIPDYADTAVNTPISSFYKTRVISSKQFAP